MNSSDGGCNNSINWWFRAQRNWGFGLKSNGGCCGDARYRTPRI